MLKESPSGELPGGRRWYTDNYFDLIVWMDTDKSIRGFQLCYDKFKTERAITWMRDKGFSHERIDDGESNPAKNLTPVLLPDGICPINEVLDHFIAASTGIDAGIRTFVENKLKEYASIEDA